MKLNGVTVAVAGPNASGSSTNQLIEIEFEMTVRSVGVSGTAFIQGTYVERNPTGNNSFTAVNTAATVINTTVPQVLDITAQWGTADSNSITVTNCVVNVSRS